MKQSVGKTVAAVMGAAVLLIGSATALTAAQEAVRVWIDHFLPAMLPFFLLTPFLAGPDARVVYERIFGRVLRALFRVPGRAAGAICAGWVAGSPAGAIACVSVSGDMTPGEYERSVYLCCGLSPAYLITAVGVGYCASPRAGWTLAISQFGALALSGLLLRGYEPREAALPVCIVKGEQVDRIGTALAQCARVCGWMVVFGVLSALLTAGLGDGTPGWAISAFCEIAGGARQIALLPVSDDMRVLLLSAFCGFGGLCVLAQCASASGVPPLRLLCVKLLHAALSALICCAVQFSGDLRLPAITVDALTVSVVATAFTALIVCLYAYRRAVAGE